MVEVLERLAPSTLPEPETETALLPDAAAIAVVPVAPPDPLRWKFITADFATRGAGQPELQLKLRRAASIPPASQIGIMELIERVTENLKGSEAVARVRTLHAEQAAVTKRLDVARSSVQEQVARKARVAAVAAPGFADEMVAIEKLVRDLKADQAAAETALAELAPLLEAAEAEMQKQIAIASMRERAVVFAGLKVKADEALEKLAELGGDLFVEYARLKNARSALAVLDDHATARFEAALLRAASKPADVPPEQHPLPVTAPVTEQGGMQPLLSTAPAAPSLSGMQPAQRLPTKHTKRASE